MEETADPERASGQSSATYRAGAMKQRIREKLTRMDTKFSDPSPVVTAAADSGFMDLCVTQLIEGESLSVRDLAEVLQVSEDWVLKNFNDGAGTFRRGKVIRYPYVAVKAKIRSMLKL